jgi:hypothetical protein
MAAIRHRTDPIKRMCPLRMDTGNMWMWESLLAKKIFCMWTWKRLGTLRLLILDLIFVTMVGREVFPALKLPALAEYSLDRALIKCLYEVLPTKKSRWFAGSNTMSISSYGKSTFITYRQDNKRRDAQVIRRYMIQKPEDYHKYNRLCGSLRQLAHRLSLQPRSAQI